MKLLFDQNVPRKVLQLVNKRFPGSDHLIRLKLELAPDPVIWDYAREHGFTIVTKDHDFVNISILMSPPPQVIWLRVGNAKAEAIATLLLERLDLLEEFEQHVNQAGILILP